MRFDKNICALGGDVVHDGLQSTEICGIESACNAVRGHPLEHERNTEGVHALADEVLHMYDQRSLNRGTTDGLTSMDEGDGQV